MEISATERLNCSSLTASDNFLGFVNCLYDYMPVKSKASMDGTQMEYLVSTVKKARALDSVIQQLSGFSRSPSSLDYSETMSKRASAIVESMDEWRLIFNGPPHSGTSTVMGLAAREVIQRMRPDALIFAVNWIAAIARVTDMSTLCEFVVTHTINSFSRQCGMLFPIAPTFITYFNGFSSSSVVPSLPMSVSRMPRFPVAAVELLAKRLFSAMKNEEDDPIEFLKRIVAFPAELAGCFGYRKVVFVYDHIDACDVRFSDDRSGPTMFDCVVEAMSGHDFLVTSRAPRVTHEKLGSLNSEFVNMEDFIQPNYLDQLPMIIAAKPAVRITKEMCRGCPAYVHRFCAIVTHLVVIEREAQEKSHKRGFVSVVTDFKGKLAETEFLHLCQDLTDAEAHGFTEDLVDKVRNSRFLSLSLKHQKQK